MWVPIMASKSGDFSIRKVIDFPEDSQLYSRHLSSLKFPIKSMNFVLTERDLICHMEIRCGKPSVPP